MPLNLRNALNSTSKATRIGLVVGTVLLLIIAVAVTSGLVGSFKDRAYQKREAERVAERQQDEDEKAQLRVEREKYRIEAAEAGARADAMAEVATSKRADRAQTAKELQQIEQNHQTHKAEVEAAGGTMSDAELRAELCRALARRGFKPCPD